jgi:hypothetical protein
MKGTPFVSIESIEKPSTSRNHIPPEVPKPYTTPPGFVSPTMAEQWRYAMNTHTWSRYGLPAAFLLGFVGYLFAYEGKEHQSKATGDTKEQGNPP